MAKTKRDGLPQVVTDAHLRFPHKVMDSAAYSGASHTARSLLLEVCRQLNGRNNGHLQLTESWLMKRGWSKNTPARARAELIERGLIVQTRQGGRNYGPSLYAVTWLSIDNYVGLDIGPRNFARGAWAMSDKFQMPQPPRAGCAPAQNEVKCTQIGTG